MTKESLQQAFKSATQLHAKSTMIVTICDDSGRYAMAATAVLQLTEEPPSMLLCVEKKASLYPFLKKGADFCINILSETQDNILELCVNGAQGEERFSMGDWRTSQFGIPYLADGQASIICSSAECWEYTTHGVFVGIASEAYVNSDVSPLIYYRQGFTSLRA